MIKYISEWAEQIIIAVIIVTILEMILPKGNSKKYIKTIIGVYILYTIIAPGIRVFTGSDIKIDYSEYEKYFNTSEVSSDIKVNSVEDTYKIEIQKRMKSDVEKLGYTVNYVNLDFDIDKGIIKDVAISVINEEKQENNNIDISINKIDIGNKNEKNYLTSEQIQEIKQKINEDYGIEYENITINSI